MLQMWAPERPPAYIMCLLFPGTAGWERTAGRGSGSGSGAPPPSSGGGKPSSGSGSKPSQGGSAKGSKSRGSGWGAGGYTKRGCSGAEWGDFRLRVSGYGRELLARVEPAGFGDLLSPLRTWRILGGPNGKARSGGSASLPPFGA